MSWAFRYLIVSPNAENMRIGKFCRGCPLQPIHFTDKETVTNITIHQLISTKKQNYSQDSRLLLQYSFHENRPKMAIHRNLKYIWPVFAFMTILLLVF